MLSPRQRRLIADLGSMNELSDRSSTVEFRAEGDPPETYYVMITAPGLAPRDGKLTVRQLHRCRIYLHTAYPRRPPVITWMTPILHPNILPPERNGGVCLGGWSAGESLADVVGRLIDLVSYRSFNAADPLDQAAADWVVQNGVRPGSDLRALVEQEFGHDEQVVVSLGRKSAL